MNNFILRTLSALVLIPFALGIIYVGGYYFTTLIIISAILMSFEWKFITNTAENKKVWNLLGVIYITLPCVSLIVLRNHNNGLHYILWLFSIVWATDIGAYICGRLIGGWKLAPKISPNKTWAGLLGGISLAAAVSFTLSYNKIIEFSPNTAITLSIVLAIYAQIGDLIESALKRHFNVKDSGNLIPGHGGILDRVDSLVLTSPKLCLFIIILGLNN